MGLFLIDKPVGISSNRALSEFKRTHNVSKAGFSGVLDPFASGLLIIATGQHTKLLDIFLNNKKTYTGTILFGQTTTTLDTEGEIISQVDDIDLNINEIRNKINEQFIGEIYQIPPIYSNIKVNGQRARTLANRGEEVELTPKKRNVYSFKIISLENNKVKFEVEVSSGTYIRSLAFDLGKALGYPAMLTELRRIKIGDIEVDNIEVNPYDTAKLKTINLSDKMIADLINGKEVEADFEFEEFVGINKDYDIWIKKLKNNKFKIYKRLR